MILIPVSSFRATARNLCHSRLRDSRSPYVPRTSPLFSAVFHAARTLSGSLRSPPSPRGEGFVRRYSFSTYACIRSDVMGKAVFSYRSLQHLGKGDRVSGARVLSLTAHLRRISLLAFILPVPYPPLRSTPRGEGYLYSRRSRHHHS